MPEPDPGITIPTYRADHFDPLVGAEDRHFWFRCRNRCLAAALRLIPEAVPVRDVIEHGCGTGFVLPELQRRFPLARVVGADLFPEALRCARRRFSGELIQGDLLQDDRRDAFDVVALFDVLEHLDDDAAALRIVHGQLRPGGHLVMTVPAHMSLWSAFDRASGHRRRYDRRGLLERLREADFAVAYCTEFMSALLPLAWLRRRGVGAATSSGSALAPRQSTERELRIHPWLNRGLELALAFEPPWIRRGWRLPPGTSLLALARKG